MTPNRTGPGTEVRHDVADPRETSRPVAPAGTRRAPGTSGRAGDAVGERLRRGAGRLGAMVPGRLRSDTALSLAGFAGTLVLLLGFSLHQWRAGRNYYDGAYFAQAAWLISHGHEPIVTIRGVHMFADHAYYVFYPIAYLTRVWHDPLPVLLVVQGVALAAGVFPLAAFARKVAGLGTAGTAAVLGAYALFPALHNVNAAEYHPETTAVPFIFAGALFCAQRRWPAYYVCVVIVLISREDLAIPVATAGALMVLHRRARHGLVTMVLAGLSLGLSLAVVIPHFAAGNDLVGGLYAKYGGSTAALVQYTFEHPLGIAADLLTVGNLVVFIALLAPVCFVALAGWRWVLPAIPLQVLYLLSSRESAHTILVQYVTQAIPFILLGFAVGLGRIAARRSLAVPLAAATALSFLSSAVVSPISDQHPWRPGGEFAATKQRIADIVPAGAAVTATEAAWSALAERRELFPYPITDPNWLLPQPGLPAEPVCWAVVDSRSPLLERTPLDPATWAVVYQDADFAVYRSC